MAALFFKNYAESFIIISLSIAFIAPPGFHDSFLEKVTLVAKEILLQILDIAPPKIKEYFLFLMFLACLLL